jgi:hypothetical protein
MAKRSARSDKRRIRRSSKVARSTVTRAQLDKALETFNERGMVITEIRKELDVQFRRMAQLQAELDAIKHAWQRMKNRG